MRICNEEDKNRIIDYIGEDYYKCLYMYLDYIKYGLTNPNVNVYIQENNSSINLLVLTYYTGMHVFSKNMDFNVHELAELINEKNPSMICGEKRIISKISTEIKDYYVEYGWVKCLDQSLAEEANTIRRANHEDFRKITNLLLSDEGIGASYTFDRLYNQLLELFESKYGRNYVLEDNGEIIAHVSTGAENDKVAIMTDLIVNQSYRHQGIGYKMCRHIANELISEGKKVYLINYTEASSALYEKVGFKICCEWGKMFKNINK